MRLPPLPARREVDAGVRTFASGLLLELVSALRLVLEPVFAKRLVLVPEPELDLYELSAG